jgi:hypothetical protein
VAVSRETIASHANLTFLTAGLNIAEPLPQYCRDFFSAAFTN